MNWVMETECSHCKEVIRVTTFIKFTDKEIVFKCPICGKTNNK